MVNCWSICGPVSEKNAMTLLRYNTKMLHGAFAVRKVNGGEMTVIQANQLVDTADPLEVTRVINSIAWQADKVEEKRDRAWLYRHALDVAYSSVSG